MSSGNSSEGHDFGMRQVSCPVCAGKGCTIVPHAITHDDGTIETWETADICPICGGEKTVWV